MMGKQREAVEREGKTIPGEGLGVYVHVVQHVVQHTMSGGLGKSVSIVKTFPDLQLYESLQKG
jgi:hypothetical protein